MAGVTQRTMFGLRREVEEKLGRLPLRYFDSHPARRHPEPGHQRHRQPHDDAAAGPQPAPHLGAHDRAACWDHVLDLAAARGGVRGHDPAGDAWSPSSIARRSQVQFAAQWEQTGTLNGLVEETHTGHALVQVFGRRRATIDEFDRQNRRLYEASFRAQFLSGIIQPTMQFLANINYVVIAVLGGYLVASGSISLGDVQAFIQYSRQFTMPITQIASQMNMLQSGLASAERVFEFLDAPEEAPDHPRPARPARRGRRPPERVKLEHVSFRYEPDEPLIEDFTLDVAPGQTVAIVGPTGAGKTTIVNLLVRFYEIDAGHILLDGIDYRDLTRDEVRSSFGMVLQDTWLFAGTIRDNIAYGRPGGDRRGDRRRRRGRPTSTTSSAPCPTATTPCSTRTPPTSPRARSSC